jgi:hypothetical protein
MATAVKRSPPRKQAVNPKQLRETAGRLIALGHEMESAANGLGKRRVAVDGAGMSKRAVMLLQQYLLNLEKSRLAAES